MSSREIHTFVSNYLIGSGIGAGGLSLRRLAPDGSQRSFWRAAVSGSDRTWIVMSHPPDSEPARRENKAYLRIGAHLRGKGLAVPRILHWDLGTGLFLLDDMGTTSLQEAVAKASDPLPLYRRVVTELFRLQVRGARGFDTRWCCQTSRYDASVMIDREAHYFRDAFLVGYLGRAAPGDPVETGFAFLADAASRTEPVFFLHRDFQSRNILVSRDRIGIIDWQGGRLGPLGYDLASLLIDPYTALPSPVRETLYRDYLELLQRRHPELIGPFQREFPYLAVQRNLQILGAFGHLTRVLNKPHFEGYIPRALGSLQDLLRPLEDPELGPLKDLVETLVPQKMT